jgi:hypothetical protein
MASGGAKNGGVAAVKGLRLLTLSRTAEGFGFHMYTNREREGQYIKTVSPNTPADLSGMLPGDHVLAVDGVNVTSDTHHQVVEKVRTGTGDKKLLVIDIDTEDEMKSKGEQINPEDAIVMIPRAAPEPPPPPQNKEDTDTNQELNLTSMEAARRKGRRAKEMVKNRGWKESVEAYNQL